MFNGKRLREQREILGLSQEKLAERIDVHVNTIRRWEQNKQVPDATKLNLLAEALNTTVAYLSGENDGVVLQEGAQFVPKPDYYEHQEKRLIIRNNDMYVNLPETREGFEMLRRFFDIQGAKNAPVVPAL
ncbi:MAG: helix-turn-helix transcriptional regulator [Synergistaceae bacterium]|nr:helix-turn-helix transcriptional regulator [Synergistaceae bacterium]